MEVSAPDRHESAAYGFGVDISGRKSQPKPCPESTVGFSVAFEPFAPPLQLS